MLSLTILVLFTTIRFSQSTVYSCDPSASCGCSQNSASVNRIVGGETAAAATWGWAVSLAINKNSLCGGSIISSSWIITAAHCANGVTPSKITVYAGSAKPWAGSQTRVASQIIVHPSYNSDTKENDIALVQLATPLLMTDPNVNVICLPSVSQATLAAGEWPSASSSVSASFSDRSSHSMIQ